MPQSVSPVGLAQRGMIPRKQFYTKLFFFNTVILAFDSDVNDSGQQAALRLAQHLRTEGVSTRRVRLPDGHDPNRFFVGGGDAYAFQCLLEEASL